MTDTNEQPRITLKAGSGYNAPWLTIPFDNSEQAKAILADVRDSGLLESIVETAQVFEAVNNAAPLTQPQAQQAGNVAPGPWANSGPTQAAPQQAPAQQGAQLHPGGETCGACGTVLQFKQVNRKSDGRTFKFWACPNQRSRNDGHTSKFAD